MARLRGIDEGILYRNPLPGHQAICAFHPFVLPLSEEDLLCFYRVGQAMYSLDGRVAWLRSTDGGRTCRSRPASRDRLVASGNWARGDWSWPTRSARG